MSIILLEHKEIHFNIYLEFYTAQFVGITLNQLVRKPTKLTRGEFRLIGTMAKVSQILSKKERHTRNKRKKQKQLEAYTLIQ